MGKHFLCCINASPSSSSLQFSQTMNIDASLIYKLIDNSIDLQIKKEVIKAL